MVPGTSSTTRGKGRVLWGGLELTLFQPPPAVQPYIPDEDVIKQNEAFDFALKAAPNVLYGRFKQYGQVCVPQHETIGPGLTTLNSSAFLPGAQSLER